MILKRFGVSSSRFVGLDASSRNVLRFALLLRAALATAGLTVALLADTASSFEKASSMVVTRAVLLLVSSSSSSSLQVYDVLSFFFVSRYPEL